MSFNIFLYAICGLFILGGLSVLVQYYYRAKKWIHAKGIVVKLHEKQSHADQDGRKTTLYSATLSYQLPNESQTREFRDDVWSAPCPYVIGQEIPMFVNPHKPSQACVKHTISRIIVSIACIAAGVLLFLVTEKNLP